MSFSREQLAGKFAVVNNRGVCAAKIGGDLENNGINVYYLYMPGDKTTPVIKKAIEKGRAFAITTHMDLTSVENALLSVEADINQQRAAAGLPPLTEKISYQPGWGYGSEDANTADFINSLKGYKFAGPVGHILSHVGPKNSARNLAAEVSKKACLDFNINPPYIDLVEHSLQDLKKLFLHLNIGRIPSELESLYQSFLKYYELVKAMSRVFIKANLGGGGRGMRNVDPTLMSFKTFVGAVIQTRIESQMFGDSSVMIEKAMAEPTKFHLEAQLIMGQGKSVFAGLRNCTPQIDGQKLLEMNVIPNDFPQEIIDALTHYAVLKGEKLASMGYNGLATCEFMLGMREEKITEYNLPPDTELIKILGVDYAYDPKTQKTESTIKKYNLMFLEINPRLQVEHPVTECTMMALSNRRAAKKVISLPFILDALSRGRCPLEILATEYGIRNPEIFQKLPTERFLHWRFCATIMDKYNSVKMPAPYARAADCDFGQIAPALGSYMKVGGVGDGSQDSFFAGVWGSIDSTLITAKKFLGASARLQSLAPYGGPHGDNSSYLVSGVFPRLFEEGLFSHKISTNTFHDEIRGEKVVKTPDEIRQLYEEEFSIKLTHTLREEQQQQISRSVASDLKNIKPFVSSALTVPKRTFYSAACVKPPINTFWRKPPTTLSAANSVQNAVVAAVRRLARVIK